MRQVRVNPYSWDFESLFLQSSISMDPSPARKAKIKGKEELLIYHTAALDTSWKVNYFSLLIQVLCLSKSWLNKGKIVDWGYLDGIFLTLPIISKVFSTLLFYREISRIWKEENLNCWPLEVLSESTPNFGFDNQNHINQMWWCTPVIPETQRWNIINSGLYSATLQDWDISELHETPTLSTFSLKKLITAIIFA